MADALCRGTPIYPIGGGTSLDYGLPAARPGIGVSLAELNRVVDYPARDMTITVEAGITMAELADDAGGRAAMAADRRAAADAATLGGVVATASSGPRRYGYGTMRDYVIGISAVDGRGMPFKAGGRVVKNVAGYDFCKLLTGSLGTLGVITQVTLKIKPLPEQFGVRGLRRAAIVDMAEPLLAALVTSRNHARGDRTARRARLARQRRARAADGRLAWHAWSSAWKAPRPKSIGCSSSWPPNGARWA